MGLLPLVADDGTPAALAVAAGMLAVAAGMLVVAAGTGMLAVVVGKLGAGAVC